MKNFISFVRAVMNLNRNLDLLLTQLKEVQVTADRLNDSCNEIIAHLMIESLENSTMITTPTFFEQLKNDNALSESPFLLTSQVLESIFGKQLHSKVEDLAVEVAILPRHRGETAFEFSSDEALQKLNAMVCIYKFLRSGKALSQPTEKWT